MTNGKIHGHVEAVKGAVKETTGKVVGNQTLRAEGATQKAAGHAEVNAQTAANHVGGQMDSTKGSVKSTVGNVLGNEKMQAEGHAGHAKGETTKAFN
ncbi:hypothetical protein HKX48_000509 [Thoreauomyces humboldtii]|nr:hypothetical protein HKX48_000509 [Thoreauomyces humboldtii]